eukprot:GILI01041888.1.p1 GENE.GILI01041888.1~~GILI01041888.1.p1  ORF type:complete len:132 (+),score=10.28 GILI01041888.1:52-396(+)
MNLDPPSTLPGKSLKESIVRAEMLNTTAGSENFDFCWGRCITHFGEDALPYHTGEKSCMDRCMSKIRFGFKLSKDLLKEFNTKMADDETEFGWMKQLGTQAPGTVMPTRTAVRK